MTTECTVVLEGGPPWGFRIVGGVDQGQELHVSRVNRGGKAFSKGISEGDSIISINDCNSANLTNSEAHSLLRKSKNFMKLSIKKKSSSKSKRSSCAELGAFETSKSDNTQTIQKNVCDEINENSTLSSDRTSSQSQSSILIEVIKAKDQELKCSLAPATTSSSLIISGYTSSSTDNNNGDNVAMARKRKRKSRQNNNATTSSSQHLKQETTATNKQESETIECDNKTTKTKNFSCDDTKRELISESVTTNPDNGDCSSSSSSSGQKQKCLYKVEFPDVPRQSPKQKSPTITKSRSLDDDDVPKITELEPESSSSELLQSESCTICDVDSEVEWESGDDLPPLIKIKPPKEFLSTACLQIEEDLGVAETSSRISPEEEKNLRDFLGGLNLVNSPSEEAEASQQKENYKERKAKKRAAIVQHFIPYMQQPKFLDVIQEESSDVSDKESRNKSPNKTPEGPLLLETRVTYPDVFGAEIINTSVVAESSSDAELVFLDDSDDDGNDDNEEEESTKINPLVLLSQLTPPPTPDVTVTPKEPDVDIIIKKKSDGDTDDSSSSCSDDTSSKTASQCTAKYNPSSSSIGDVTSLLQEYNQPPAPAPGSLREICLSKLMNLPFGPEIIEELASVSRAIQDITFNNNNNSKPQFKMRVRPFLQKLNSYEQDDYNDVNDSEGGVKWSGYPTETDPNVLVCLSPTQRAHLDTTRRIPQEGDKLLDMHAKFLNRSLPASTLASSQASPSSVVLTSVQQLSGHRTGDDEEDEQRMTNNRLLAIIRDSDIENCAKCNRNLTRTLPTTTLPRTKSRQKVELEEEPSPAARPWDPDEGRRLKAKNLSEWLQLARDKSSSETSLNAMERHEINNTTTKTIKSSRRRLSLPQDIYQRQIDYIREKEIELQREIEQLEEEKRKLYVEMVESQNETPGEGNNNNKSPPRPPVRKDRPKSTPMAPTEFFRQQMYEEYMSQVAARRDRKHNKVIKISSTPHDYYHNNNNNTTITTKEGEEEAEHQKQNEVIHVPGIEEEFMDKVKEKRKKFGLQSGGGGSSSIEDKKVDIDNNFSDQETDSEPVLVLNRDSISTAKGLPKHLQEFVSITKDAEESGEETDNTTTTTTTTAATTGEGVWAPGKRTSPVRFENIPNKGGESQSNVPPPPPIWTPKSAGSSPIVERKEFRPVSFESPTLGRKQRTPDVQSSTVEPPWKGRSSSDFNTSSSGGGTFPTNSTFDSQIPRSKSTDFSGSRLPRYQNPTITLLQKAREGQIPRGPVYINYSSDDNSSSSRRPKDEKPPLVKPGEVLYQIKHEYTSESEGEAPKKMADLGPRKYEGIGPTTKEGIPITLRSEVKDGNQHRWYKKMYDTIHKQKEKDDYVTVRYKQRRARYPYISGYFSEPEPSAYDSDASDRRSTLDRRRYLYLNDPKENGYVPSTTPTAPIRNAPPTVTPKSPPSSVIKHGQDVYKNQPGKIENYTPGKSSISEREAKQWWDEVMEIFDGHLEQQKHIPTKGHLSQALKETGYDSDSTLVFRRRDDAVHHLSPKEQKEAYRTIQKGGDVPLHGLRKPAPERPKDVVDLEYIPLTSTLTKIRIHKSPKYFTYPVNVPSLRPGLFGTYKRTAPSATSPLRPPSNKPSTTTTIVPPSPPKRRSSRNSSTLRLISTMTLKADRSPISKRHETCFKTNENNHVKYLKDKITCKLSPVTTKRNIGQDKSKLRVVKTISLTDRPVTGSKKPKQDFLQNKFFSTGQTFAEAKRNLALPKLPIQKCSKLSSLVSPNEVKKVIKTRHVSSAPQPQLKTTSSCPSTPLQSRHLKKFVKKEVLVDNNKKLNGKKLKSTPKTAEVSKEKTRNNNGNLSNSNHKKQKKSLSKSTPKNLLKKDDFPSAIKDEIKRHSEIIKTNDFFQHLFLKDIATAQKQPPPKEEDFSWIAQKTKMLQTSRRTAAFSEPSIGALMIYLKSVKPVSESKFRSLDATYTRSRSASPKTVTWKDENLVSECKRSISLPSKIPISRSSSRSPSPCLNYNRPISPTKREHSRTTRSSSPKMSSKQMKHLTTLQSRPDPVQIFFSSTTDHLMGKSKKESVPSPLSSLSSLSTTEKDVPQETASSLSTTGRRSPNESHLQKPSKRITPRTVKEMSASKRLSFRSRSAGDAEESDALFNSKIAAPVLLEKSVSFSELSEFGSLHQLHIPGRCNRFKELKNFYKTLEKFSQVEKIASSTDIRPRGKLENEIVDYNRWKEVHVKERAEKEMKLLYSKLKHDQTEKGFLFEPKTTQYWRRENDHGLRAKEKSFEDIRDELQKLSIRNERPLTSSELSLVKDLYKPLWRGSSVIDLASSMVQKRSHSEESKRDHFVPPLMKTDFGFLRQIWTSLSTEQLNNLKSQLSEIYGKNGTATLPKPVPKKTDTNYFVDVYESKNVSDGDLKVRRCSESSAPRTFGTERKTVLSENEKKNLSLSLCKEAVDRLERSTAAKGNVILPRETRGSIAASVSEATSPRTCYSLEISEDEIDKKSKDNDYLLVLTERLPARKSAEIRNTLSNWAEPKKSQNQSTETVGKSTSETESASTDESTKTAIFVDNNNKKEEVTKKIKYFEEKAAEEEKYTPIVYKPADISDSEKSDCSQTTSPKPLLIRSQSNQNLKDLFGEKLPTQKVPQDIKTKTPTRVFFRRVRSDPELNRKSQIHIPGQKAGDVDSLRRKYEYPWIGRKSRSRTRRGGVVSPLFFRPQDRLMPHINIISKIASLCSKRDETQQQTSTEELASYLGCPVGEVEKLRKKFDSPDRNISLLGRMFTSSPNIHELKDLAPYLVGDWTAHKYPRLDDNTRSLSSPEHSPASRDTSLMRKDRSRPKSFSPTLSRNVWDDYDKKKKKKFDPKTDPMSRYCPEERYRSWLLPNATTTTTRPTVKFKDPEPPAPPPKRNLITGNVLKTPESPRKYVENEVTIHYKTPVVQEVKDLLSEEELARRQAAHMRQVYEEERRKKYLQQLQDMNSRRHTDNFVPSQKSPIPLNRYDDFPLEVPKVSPRPRSPEPRLVARALYNFVGQTARELTFRKGDLIYIKRQIDKNWYEGELNAMIGLFPTNYVEIVPYDGVKSTTKRAHEGQARAKYNFIAQTHLELSLAKGELVVITRRVDDNWFEGRIGGRKGIFPVSYVEVLVEPGTPAPPAPSKPVGSPAAHTLLLNGTASGIESMGSHSYLPPSTQQFTTSYRAKPVAITDNGYASLSRSPNAPTSKSPYSEALHIDTQNEPLTYRSLYKYRPQNDDELELLEGDIVYVLEKCDDGWFVGSSQRTGHFGTFPGNYVERVN